MHRAYPAECCSSRIEVGCGIKQLNSRQQACQHTYCSPKHSSVGKQLYGFIIVIEPFYSKRPTCISRNCNHLTFYFFFLEHYLLFVMVEDGLSSNSILMGGLFSSSNCP